MQASALVYLLALGAILLAGNRWADDRAAAQAEMLSRSTAAARSSLLVSELQKYRLIPIVLGEYPEVRAALAAPKGQLAVRLDDKLEQLARMIGSSVIYVMDGQGRTIAASNAGLPSSFVGQNYGFRPYFTSARARGAAEFFGLGTVSGQPGLYLSRRVGTTTRGGVVVVKFGFEAVERGWASATEPVFVTDRNGVVLITNRPDWRFRTTRALPPGLLVEMHRTRQFGSAPLAPLPVRPAGPGLVAEARRGGSPNLYTPGVLPVPVAGWRLTVLEPVRPIRAALLATARLATVVAAVLLILPLFWWLRTRERSDLAAVARLRLEEDVASRTEDLDRAQTRFREAREELAHANRLGSIGQITAAVAHEVNQPAAAIRSFAENGVELLRRGNREAVAANLATIAALTIRIGAITAELRTYARRGSGEVRAVPLDRAIDGALWFTVHRLSGAGVAIERAGAVPVDVHADPLRLEQVLVNLLHNAVDALEGAAVRRIRLSVAIAGPVVDLLLCDTGAGIDTAVADTLFDPFATSKPDGLGLGLGIARDIAREFGGDLEVVPASPPWRTAFRLRLRRA
ncbi:MAG: ATP-binding protein [Janthinobacterium lividum]